MQGDTSPCFFISYVSHTMTFKSFIYSVLCLYVLAIGSSVLASASFTDTSSHSYEIGINYLEQKGIVNGYSDGSFKPNSTINRAEFTKIIMGSVSTKQERARCNYSLFPDVSAGEWFTPYICVAKERGVIKGYADGMFKPTQTINFSEAAKIVSEVYGSNFTNSSVWYEPYMQFLDEKNAIPVSISSFTKSITRAEMSEIVWRLDAQKIDQKSMSYINNRLVNASTSGVSSTQRQTYIKICKARSKYQSFEQCMQELIKR